MLLAFVQSSAFIAAVPFDSWCVSDTIIEDSAPLGISNHCYLPLCRHQGCGKYLRPSPRVLRVLSPFLPLVKLPRFWESVIHHLAPMLQLPVVPVLLQRLVSLSSTSGPPGSSLLIPYPYPYPYSLPFPEN
jgi:hypothetical protein